MEVKDILFNLRKNNNLTQGEMAKKLFVTRQAVSRWENGKTIPNVDTLKLISNIFDISINSLITDNKLNDIQNDKINSNRFIGFAQLYENSRPTIPDFACDMVLNYLEHNPEQIVDLGCGTGLSTLALIDKCNNIIGIDPNEEMLSIAKLKSDKISFIKAYSDNTTLPDNSTDIVICSQSFHWMQPTDTLREVNRILKPNGIFATIDCDWPPVCSLEAELAYSQLLNKVRFIELENQNIFKTFQRWNKNKHLQNIKQSGYFKYAREIVFMNKEKYNTDRFIGIALSQGGLQTILKTHPDLIENDIELFEKKIKSIYGNNEFDINFCYRMRIGVK
ncbi:MAG: methyltransferase domain-containing protein [Clostridiales bacterium]|nr:methyltransferase domain-containing protein [Clostridiales bacterium]